MFISKLQLKNFKRFSDLTIELSPLVRGSLGSDQEPPKLVLLIGANGSGKSNIFDAFEIFSQTSQSEREKTEVRLKGEYFTKSSRGNTEVIYEFGAEEKYSLHIIDWDNIFFILPTDKGYPWVLDEKGQIAESSKKEYEQFIHSLEKIKFYGRTAFRSIIDLETKFNADDYREKDVQKVIEKNLDRANRSIDSDKRWDGDILYSFKEEIDRKQLKTQLNESLNRIFQNNSIGHFQIESIKSEIGRSIKLSLEVLIKKGNSIFPYEYLSAGEKQLFAILLNLYLRKKYLENTIVYLDEIDLHLNTAIQCDLLKEITENIIPDNSQIWIASHSLGFIDYAREYSKGVIIDFDNLNFDEVQVLEPVDKNDPNKPYFKVALGESFLVSIIEEIKDKYRNQVIAFSEGDNCHFLEKAKELICPELKVKFLDGQGKDNLKAVFHQLKNSKEKILFIFDSDAENEFNNCKNVKNTNLISLLLPKNQSNNLCNIGIENLFDKKFFEDNFLDRNQFYFRENDNKGGYSYKLDKTKFCEYILKRNKPEDFTNFKPLFSLIEEALK